MPIAKLYDSHNKKRKDLKPDPPELSEHVMDHPAVDIKDDARHKGRRTVYTLLHKYSFVLPCDGNQS